MFGARLAERILAGDDGPEPSGALRAVLGHTPLDGIGCTRRARPAPIRCGAHAERHRGGRIATGPRPSGIDVTKLRDILQRAMTRGAGVVRSAESLAGAAPVVEDTADRARRPGRLPVDGGELATCSRWPMRCSCRRSARTESRGAHAAPRVPRHRPGLAAAPRPRRRCHRRTGSDRVSGAARPTRGYRRAVAEAVARALDEDLGPDGDLTAALVPPRRHGALRAAGPRATACWPAGPAPLRRSAASAPDLDPHVAGGRRRPAEGRAPPSSTSTARCVPILTAERTALNFLGHLSGVATLTARFVAAAHDAQPRRRSPGHAQDHARACALLEKAAVRAGGGTNHRAGLSDAVLVKDNHLAGTTITDAVARARALWPGRMVEIECDTLDQVAEAARAGADAVAPRQHGPGHRGRGRGAAHLRRRPDRSSPRCPAA